MNSHGYTSWNSNPFQRLSFAQNTYATARASATTPNTNQGNGLFSHPYAQAARQNSLPNPEIFNTSTSLNPLPNRSEQPSYQSERYFRDRSAINSAPDANLDALRQAMEASITPPSSPLPTQRTISPTSRVISFVKGLTPLKATLARKFPEARYSVIEKLNELGVKWEEPHGTGWMYCEYGVKGTVDYVAFAVRWVVNGAPGGKPAMPGGYEWFTKVEISKDKGSGARFREIGTEVLNAAKYEVRGPAMLDYSITTWGLY